MTRPRFNWWTIAGALPLVFLALFYFYPLAAILRLSLAPGDVPGGGSLGVLVADTYVLRVFLFSAWQATLSTALTLLLGLPAAYVFARFRWRGKTVLRALATVPFVLPTVVVAAAFGALLGPNGVANAVLQSVFGFASPPIRLQGTLGLILLAHVFYNFTVVLRIVGGMWSNLPPSLEEAAAVLGATRWRVLREITLPLLLPAIGAAALLVFIFTFGAFGTILILGGARYATLEIEIYRQTLELFNLPVAAVLSLLQIAVSLVLTTVYTRLQERTALPLDLRPQRSVERPFATWRQRVFAGTVVGVMLVLIVAPLLALAVRSLSLGGAWSVQFYRLLGENRTNSYFFVPPSTAIRNSVGFATISTLFALLIGIPATYLLLVPRRRLRLVLDPLFMLPLGTSAVTLGFGYLIALDEPPLNLRASPLLVPIAHTLIAFPFVVRALLPVLRGINPRLREAAAVLGASPARVRWEVDAPIIARAVLIGSVFAFTISLGEFGATLLLNRPEYPTMPVVVYRFLGQPGVANYGQALAMSTLLMLVTAVGFVAIERLRIGEWGEF
jgi:thiamine transport system permease protein